MLCRGCYRDVMPKNDLVRNRPNRSAAYFSREICALSAHFSRQFCAEPTLFQDIRQKTIHSIRENDTFTLGVIFRIIGKMYVRFQYVTFCIMPLSCRHRNISFRACDNAFFHSDPNRVYRAGPYPFRPQKEQKRRSNFFSAESRRKGWKGRLCIYALKTVRLCKKN